MYLPNLALVTGHNSFYQNAKSIKHVMVTRYYRIVQFTAVPNKWWKACFGHDHSLFSYHQYVINAGGEHLQWKPVPAQWNSTIGSRLAMSKLQKLQSLYVEFHSVILSLLLMRLNEISYNL